MQLNLDWDCVEAVHESVSGGVDSNKVGLGFIQNSTLLNLPKPSSLYFYIKLGDTLFQRDHMFSVATFYDISLFQPS